MYCPRCGSPNTDTTKFCRKCGLGLTQVTGYVASGGTAQLQQPLQPPQTPSNLLSKATDGLTPKQKLILTILLMVFAPAIFGTLGGVTGLGELGGRLAGISAVLLPVGVVFAVMRYKAQQRRLHESMMQNQMYPAIPIQHFQPPSATPYGLPQPGQQPIQQPIQQPVYHPPVAPPPTNPLKTPGSITEDETRKFH